MAALQVCIASLVAHAIGFAASLVAGFAVAHREAIEAGFPDNLDTYALISGLWTSAFALGAFIGPTFAGVLVDKFTFRDACLLVIAAEVSVLALSIAYLTVHIVRAKRRKDNGRFGINSTTYLFILLCILWCRFAANFNDGNIFKSRINVFVTHMKFTTRFKLLSELVY